MESMLQGVTDAVEVSGKIGNGYRVGDPEVSIEVSAIFDGLCDRYSNAGLVLVTINDAGDLSGFAAVHG